MGLSCVYPEQMLETFELGVALLIAFFVFLVVAAAIIIKAVICCRIFFKAGYHWALGLLMIVPIANIIMSFYLAFAKWPIEKDIQQLRQQLNTRQPPKNK